MSTPISSLGLPKQCQVKPQENLLSLKLVHTFHTTEILYKSHELLDVKAEIGLKDIEIIDNEVDGTVSGEIVSIIYKGDHYQVIIRTEEDEDFVVDTEYLWNEHDRVSVKVDPSKIKLTLKGEIKKYVKA